MLLSEVARTGRRFKRKSDPDVWYWLEGKEIKRFRPIDSDSRGFVFSFDAEMLVATDWESEPKKMEITKQDLNYIARILSDHPIVNQRRLAPMEFMKLVIEELGLDD